MSEKPLAPHEMPEYKQLQAEVNKTKALLFSERDKIVDFEVEYPDGSKKTLHFRRLRATEWEHVTDEIHKVGLLDEGSFKTATKEQLAKLRLCYCLALGYASADGLNAEDWRQLDDKYLTDLCFYHVMNITGVSKTALENLNWFRSNGGGQDEVGGVPQNG